MSSGYVYILSNESMPGLLKIGRSKYGGASRKPSLQTTGVPAAFKLEFEIFTQDMVELEKLAHEKLQDSRYSENREFFKVDIEPAITALLDMYLEDICYQTCCVEEYDAVIGCQYIAHKTGIHPFIIAGKIKNIDPDYMKSKIDEAFK